jgi:hypothetical protein
MQFAVPQFTEVEDRLIGPLTLKQFLVLLGAGGVVLFFWSILGPTIIFFALSVPVAIVGLASALGKYNGRPLFAYLIPFAAFLSSNRVMIFRREVVGISVSKSELKKDTESRLPKEVLEPAESRLKKLAYLLDRKTEEEGDIIIHDNHDILASAALAGTPKPKMEFSKVIDRTREQIMATARKLDAGSFLHKSSAKTEPPSTTFVSEPPMAVIKPEPLQVEPQYEPSAEETLDFTKIDEPEPSPKSTAKQKAKPSTKKAGPAKKFDPNSIFDPNA